MEREGPALELLLRRIAETPESFLGEPRIGDTGQIHVGAVVADVCRLVGVDLPKPSLARLSGKDARTDRNRLSVALLLAWILADEWFRSARVPPPKIVGVFGDGAAELGNEAPARKLVTDPDRREALARFALARMGMRPAGETVAQSEDRLTSLSATERARVLAAARAAEERARQVREALARKAAEESADKWTRE